MNNDFLEYAIDHDFGDLHFCVDRQTGLKAIIAIHNTTLGPALGGCRFLPYPDTSAAIYDVMRLARGMSYKAALANLPFGGGKSVVIKPEGPFDRVQYMRQFGKFIDSLSGRYIAALDSGAELTDMDIISEHTPFVASLTRHDGNPSPWTAKGILLGIQAAVQFKLGKESLSGLHIAIQGLGHVGFVLAELLHEQGVKISVADTNPLYIEKAIKTFNATPVSVEQIHRIPCDVFAPCALGGVLNDTSIEQLQTKIVAGAANNQLAHAQNGLQLHQKGILYATDYVINSGGLIFAAHEYLNTPKTELNAGIAAIPQALLKIFERSSQENRSCSEIADVLAEERLGLRK